MTILATLLFIIDDDKILLIKKKRGFGAGLWNGPGGKVELDESVEDAAIREVEEEVGVSPLAIKNRGALEFYFGQQDAADWKVHVFVTNQYTGSLQESQEAAPQWFDLKEVPYSKMWPDDKIWLPKILEGKQVDGRFYYEKDDWDHFKSYEITEKDTA